MLPHRCLQDGPKVASKCPRLNPRWPQNGSKMAQERPKMASRDVFSCPRGVSELGAPPCLGRWPQEWHKDGPRLPQDGPRWPKNGVKMAPDGLKLASKRSQDRLNMAPRSQPRQSILGNKTFQCNSVRCLETSGRDAQPQKHSTAWAGGDTRSDKIS